MNIIFWILFIGLCIKTGAILISFLVSLFVNSEGARNLYLGLDLFNLYSYDKTQYGFVVSLLIFFTALKAYMAYLVVKIFLKFDLGKPFNSAVTQLVSRVSIVALEAGVLAILASGYTKRLSKQGLETFQDWGGNEFLFLAGIIFIIAQIFKKGAELQTESELTV